MKKNSAMSVAYILSPSFDQSSLPAEVEKEIEKIGLEMGARKRDIKRGKIMAQNGVNLQTIESLAEGVKILEQMERLIFVQKLPSADAIRKVNRFGQQISLTDKQRIAVRSDAHKMAARSRLCPRCETEQDTSTRFCPECGREMSESSNSPSEGYDIPSTGIAIEFPQTNTASFRNAMDALQGIPNLQSKFESGKTWFLAFFDNDRIEEVAPVVDALQRCRSQRLYIDGQPQPWSRIKDMAACLINRSASRDRTEYCFGANENTLNCWGCRRLDLKWIGMAKWLLAGQWKEAKDRKRRFKYVWIVDKERIAQLLERQLYNYRLCPHLNTITSVRITLLECVRRCPKHY